MANNRMMLRNKKSGKLITIAKHLGDGWYTPEHMWDRMNAAFDEDVNFAEDWEDAYELVLENDLES